MNLLPRPDRAVQTAAVLAAAGFAGLALFQLALALGAPLGHAAWGGAHAHLSSGQRAASAIAVVVWITAALIVLGRAGIRRGRRGTRLRRYGTWFLAAISILAAVLNFASQSHWENAIWGPFSIVLIFLCATVARSPLDSEQTPPVSSEAVEARWSTRKNVVRPGGRGSQGEGSGVADGALMEQSGRKRGRVGANPSPAEKA